MGYYTRYQLTTKPQLSDEQINELELNGGYGLEGRITWYLWEEDMREASLAHPGVLFTLDGHGEESGDTWRAFFLDGASYWVKWRPPEFDPKRLP